MAQGRDVVPFARPTLPQFTLAFDRTNLHAKDARIGSRSSRWLSSSLALSAWTKLASRSASPHTGMARATTRRSLLDSASDLRMDAQRSSLHRKTNVAGFLLTHSVHGSSLRLGSLQHRQADLGAQQAGRLQRLEPGDAESAEILRETGAPERPPGEGK